MDCIGVLQKQIYIKGEIYSVKDSESFWFIGILECKRLGTTKIYVPDKKSEKNFVQDIFNSSDLKFDNPSNNC